MSDHDQTLALLHDEDLEDDFDSFLGEKLQNPAFAAAFEDAQQRARLVADLRQCRKAQKVRQKHVAQHMGVGQSTVSEFENGSDAHLSTLQRYARALGARLLIKIDMPADQKWSSLVRKSYAPKVGVSSTGGTVVKAPDSDWLNTWACESRSAGVLVSAHP